MSGEEVRKLADLKQWLEEKIRTMEEELGSVKKMLSIVDEQLKRGSFVKATEVPPTLEPQTAETGEEPVEVAIQSETRPLKRQRDGYLMANAYIQPNLVSIVPVSDIVLRPMTPPFKSYFIGKVLGGMRSADEEAVKQGKLQKDRLISFEFVEDAGRIEKVVIRNYNDRIRLNEIINTSVWTFTKMLEKQS